MIIIPALSDASFLRWIIAAAVGDVCDSRVRALATKAGCTRHHQGNIRMCQVDKRFEDVPGSWYHVVGLYKEEPGA